MAAHAAGYQLASRAFKPEDTIIQVNGIAIGGATLEIIAGPCRMESLEHLSATAAALAGSPVRILSAGAFRPGSMLDGFQALGEKELTALQRVARRHGMLAMAEIGEGAHIPFILEHVDIVEVGARNMQNYSLLKQLGRIRKPVMLKRGIAATVEEWLQSAEYMLMGGNEAIFLCERGIRTFVSANKYIIDISAIPLIKQASHLPVFVDPSGTGLENMVAPLSRAAAAAGADGIMIEVQTAPAGDGEQPLSWQQFERLLEDLRVIARVSGKVLPEPSVAERAGTRVDHGSSIPIEASPAHQ